MTGLEYILLAAFVAVVSVAVLQSRWIHKLEWGLHRQDQIYLYMIDLARDLDLQVSELTILYWKNKETIARKNIDIAKLEADYASYRLAHPVTCKRGKDGRFAKVNQFADGSKKIEKPLLADAQVGDLCKIVHINRASLNDIYDSIDFVDDDGVVTLHNTGGYWKDGCGISPSMYKVVHTEPLAPEGTAEWFAQMWQLGYRNIKMITNGKENELLSISCDKESFIKMYASDTTGWQLYKESDK